MEDDDRTSAIAALRLGLDLGMTHVDTAEMYGSGFVETLVGEAIAGRRSEVCLVSKVIPDHASRTGTIAACEGSLARLGTEWLDCYLLHWPGEHPLEDTIAAFDQLMREGKILSWGVSNFDVPDLDEVRAIAGDGYLACGQVLYHLGERAVEHTVIPWCEGHGVALVAYRPLGSRAFSRAPHEGGPAVFEDRRRSRGDSAPGRPSVPRGAPVGPRDPQVGDPRAHRRERGGPRPASHGRRDGPDRRGLPARPASPRASHAVAPDGVGGRQSMPPDRRDCPRSPYRMWRVRSHPAAKRARDKAIRELGIRVTLPPGAPSPDADREAQAITCSWPRVRPGVRPCGANG